MRGSEGDEGEPAGGWRQRRLMLAPRPWGSTSTAHGEKEAKVSKVVYADSDKSSGTATRTNGELATEACSSVGSSSNILLEFKQAARGARRRRKLR
jgi:hypothetical protein